MEGVALRVCFAAVVLLLQLVVAQAKQLVAAAVSHSLQPGPVAVGQEAAQQAVLPLSLPISYAAGAGPAVASVVAAAAVACA